MAYPYDDETAVPVTRPTPPFNQMPTAAKSILPGEPSVNIGLGGFGGLANSANMQKYGLPAAMGAAGGIAGLPGAITAIITALMQAGGPGGLAKAIKGFGKRAPRAAEKVTVPVSGGYGPDDMSKGGKVGKPMMSRTNFQKEIAASGGVKKSKKPRPASPPMPRPARPMPPQMPMVPGMNKGGKVCMADGGQVRGWGAAIKGKTFKGEC